MGSILFILCFIICTFAWDIFAKLQFLLARRHYHDFWNVFFKRMSHFSAWLAQFYGGMRLVQESALPAGALPPRFLLVTNHQSLGDIAILVCAFPAFDLKYTAKKELKFGIPSVSVGLRRGNHAFVNRKGSFAQTRRSIINLLKQPGEHICPVVFPEGTRSRTGRLGRFHTAGIRLILENSDLPVVVAAVDGGYKIQKFRDFFSRIKGLVYRTRILSVHPHVSGKAQVQELMDRTYAEISAQLLEWRARDTDGK